MTARTNRIIRKTAVAVVLLILPLSLPAQPQVTKNRANTRTTMGVVPNKPQYIHTDAIYPGGQDAIDLYLGRTLRYPEAARENNIAGRVLVRFFVDEEGRTGNIKVLRSPGGGCDSEVKRAIAAMPAWKPATSGGKRVKSVIVLPVKFDLIP